MQRRMLPLLVVAYYLAPSLDTASESGIMKVYTLRKKDAEPPMSLRVILEIANLHHGSRQGFEFLCL